LASPVGLPILKVPPGIGTRSNDASVPGIDWVNGFMSPGTFAAACCPSAAFSCATASPADTATAAPNPITTTIMLRFMLLPNGGAD
jgi:hypothetical protein